MSILSNEDQLLFSDKDDIVNTVLFLLSDKSGMIHGESIRIDGGLGVHWF